MVNEGALAQEREAILEIIEQERPLEYAHISDIDYRQKKKHIYHFIKRLIDIAGSLVGIVLLSPIFLLLSFLVKREDGGNIFYGHIRVGYHGKKIKVYKFRSMKMNVKNLEKLLTPEQLDKRFLREFDTYRNKNISNVMERLLPKKMIPVFLDTVQIPEDKKIRDISKKERRRQECS